MTLTELKTEMWKVIRENRPLLLSRQVTLEDFLVSHLGDEEAIKMYNHFKQELQKGLEA